MQTKKKTTTIVLSMPWEDWLDAFANEVPPGRFHLAPSEGDLFAAWFGGWDPVEFAGLVFGPAGEVA
jgi:hypothetical protein